MALFFYLQPQVFVLVYASKYQNFRQGGNWLHPTNRIAVHNRRKPFNLFIGRKLIYSRKTMKFSDTYYNRPWIE